MTTPNDTLEAVARAIQAEDCDYEWPYDADLYRRLARAAIKALAEREPSDAVLRAGHEATERVFDLKKGYAAIYRAMLGALVKEIGG